MRGSKLGLLLLIALLIGTFFALGLGQYLTLDALQARTGHAAADLQAWLMELELDGHIARVPGGLFQRLVRA